MERNQDQDVKVQIMKLHVGMHPSVRALQEALEVSQIASNIEGE